MKKHFYAFFIATLCAPYISACVVNVEQPIIEPACCPQPIRCCEQPISCCLKRPRCDSALRNCCPAPRPVPMVRPQARCCPVPRQRVCIQRTSCCPRPVRRCLKIQRCMPRNIPVCQPALPCDAGCNTDIVCGPVAPSAPAMYPHHRRPINDTIGQPMLQPLAPDEVRYPGNLPAARPIAPISAPNAYPAIAHPQNIGLESANIQEIPHNRMPETVIDMDELDITTLPIDIKE